MDLHNNEIKTLPDELKHLTSLQVGLIFLILSYSCSIVSLIEYLDHISHHSHLEQGVWLQSGSDWPQMGEIWGFLRSDFSAFGAGAPNALKSDLRKPRICPIWGQSDPLWSQTYHPWVEPSGRCGESSKLRGVVHLQEVGLGKLQIECDRWII